MDAAQSPKTRLLREIEERINELRLIADTTENEAVRRRLLILRRRRRELLEREHRVSDVGAKP